MIRLAVPDIDERDIEAVAAVLRTGFLVQGERVLEFERALAAYTGAPHVAAVSNCTAALHLALLSLGIAQGDRVAVSTYSWPATANAIAMCGATPVFVDIDPRTFNITEDTLRAALATGDRVRAILVVHAFGQMADMRAIGTFAQGAGIPVIEDAACALGATLDGVHAGAWGTMGCFSFHPRKALTTGEGGAIITADRARDRDVRMLRNHGLDPDALRPDFAIAGLNLRLTEFQAALGVTQLAKLDAQIAMRRSLAERYEALLRDSGFEAPTSIAPSAHVYQSYVVLAPREQSARRDAIIGDLRVRGIEANIGTHHVPLTRYFRERYEFRVGDFPGTDDAAARAIALPLHRLLTEEVQERIASELRSCL